MDEAELISFPEQRTRKEMLREFFTKTPRGMSMMVVIATCGTAEIRTLTSQNVAFFFSLISFFRLVLFCSSATCLIGVLVKTR